MNIKIQVRHDAAKESIQRYISAEFEKLRLGYEVISAECVVDHEGANGLHKTFEVVLHVPGDTIKVKESSDEVHKAVDAAMKIIEKQLTKHKETHARPGNLIRHNVERAASESS